MYCANKYILIVIIWKSQNFAFRRFEVAPLHYSILIFKFIGLYGTNRIKFNILG